MRASLTPRGGRERLSVTTMPLSCARDAALLSLCLINDDLATARRLRRHQQGGRSAPAGG
jgi:hypothetical protein